MTTGDVQLRAVSEPHVDEVVSLHVRAFQGFYLTVLGPRFLRQYYRKVVGYQRGICVGAFESSRLVGFAAGFVDPPKFYAELRRGRLRLALSALPALAADPRRALRFLRNYRRAAGAASAVGQQAIAELSSLAVEPRSGGKGIGEVLVRRFIAQAGEGGAKTVTLTTDANGNEAVNGFYRKLGFRMERRFEAQPGRYLNEYTITTGLPKAGDAR